MCSLQKRWQQLLFALYISFGCVLVPSMVLASESESLAVAVQQRYTDLNTFRAVFSQTLTHQESGAEEARTGTLAFKKPHLIRWESDAPFAQLIVANADDLWDYLPDEEVVYRYAPSIMDDSVSMLNIISGQSRIDKDFTVQEEPTEGDFRVLILFPHEPSTQFVEAKLWIHAKTFVIEKIVMLDFYGNINDIRFSEIERNPDLSDASFVFIPPKGVDIEDARQGAASERVLLP